MSGGFRFEGIDPHVAEVEAQAQRMREVVAAARPLDLAAYGVVGRAFAGAAQEGGEVAAASVRRLGAASTAVADGLRATRDAYLAAERAAGAAVEGIAP